MKHINQKSTSIPNNKEWLENVYQKKKNRSLELGIKAINEIILKGGIVSYRNVALKSKEIDPTGKGIHQNTISYNKDLHHYFQEHSTNTKRYNASKQSRKPFVNNLESYKHIKQDRDLDRLRVRYMQLKKSELIDIIIEMEEYIVHQNKDWLKNEFEKFK